MDWISVKEQVPDHGDIALVWFSGEQYAVARRLGDKWIIPGRVPEPVQPTHWMPLPDPPRG